MGEKFGLKPAGFLLAWAWGDPGDLLSGENLGTLAVFRLQGGGVKEHHKGQRFSAQILDFPQTSPLIILAKTDPFFAKIPCWENLS